MIAGGVNWYDVVVFAALLYGLWSGIRTGFSGEIVRVVGVIVMIWLAVIGYQPVGAWIAVQTGLADELANLVAFVVIAIGVFAVTTMLRLYVHKQMQQLKLGAMIENLGGGIAGIVRMAVIMMVLTLVLAMTRSPFWHEQVAKNSRFGTFVTQQFPAVAAVAQKQFPEKMWFLKKVKRPKEPGVEEADAGSTNRPH